MLLSNASLPVGFIRKVSSSFIFDRHVEFIFHVRCIVLSRMYVTEQTKNPDIFLIMVHNNEK